MPRRPVPLTIAAGLVLLESLVLVVVAILDLANLGGAGGLGVSAAIFFVILAVALGFCALALVRLQSWARAPIVLVELIELGLAWDARHTDTALAIVLAVLAVVALAGIFHPQTMRALAPEEYRD